MHKRLPSLVLVCALALIASAMAQDAQQYTLKYAPATGTKSTYEATIEGEFDIPFLGGATPFRLAATYDVTATGVEADGAVAEDITHTAVTGQAMGQDLPSSFVGKLLKAKHGKDGLLALDATSLPTPQMPSLDAFLPLVQLPRSVRYSDKPVRVGEEWTVDGIPVASLFTGAGKELGDKAKATLGLKGRLVEIKEYQGKKVAILKVDVKIGLEGIEFMPGAPFSGEISVQLDIASYLDTGTLIEANAQMDGKIQANMQGTPLDLGIKNVKCQWRTPGAEPGAPAAPAAPGAPAGGGAAQQQ